MNLEHKFTKYNKSIEQMNIALKNIQQSGKENHMMHMKPSQNTNRRNFANTFITWWTRTKCTKIKLTNIKEKKKSKEGWDIHCLE